MNDNLKKKMINLMDIFDRYINQIDIIYKINKYESELKYLVQNLLKIIKIIY